MRIMLGAIAALVVLVGILWWRLDVATGRAEIAILRADTATQQLDEQKSQAELLGKRLDALDASLKTVGERTGENNRKIGQALTTINSIQRTQDDSAESISCLDVRVPRQLDDSLR